MLAVRAAGLSDDERCGRSDLEIDFRRVFHSPRQTLGRQLTQEDLVHMYGGKWGEGEFGIGDIVETGDGDVVGDAITVSLEPGHGADREPV